MGRNGASSTSLPCLGPNPRTPSGPAAIRAAHKGRTYDRNRPERHFALQALRDGPSTYASRSTSPDRTDGGRSALAAGPLFMPRRRPLPEPLGRGRQHGYAGGKCECGKPDHIHRWRAGHQLNLSTFGLFDETIELIDNINGRARFGGLLTFWACGGRRLRGRPPGEPKPVRSIRAKVMLASSFTVRLRGKSR